MTNQSPIVDNSALRVNQASIITLLALAFPLNQPWLVVFVAAVMWIGTFVPRAGLFKLFYKHVLKPLRVVRPAPQADDPKPHLFAQGVGALFLTLASGALFAGLSALGWLLVAVVVVLAAVNLFLGFCLGCFMYYQLARRGIHADLPWWRATLGA
ncbi:MAG: DUF4395 domain-containing protein [Caldilineales bacterium]